MLDEWAARPRGPGTLRLVETSLESRLLRFPLRFVRTAETLEHRRASPGFADAQSRK